MNTELKERRGARDLDSLLHDRGLRNTPQRQLIYRIVASSPQHLSAVAVQQRLEDTMPGISLPTVYATLDLFAELGIVRKIALAEGPVIYDTGQRYPHAHMVCRQCGRIFDLDILPVNDADVAAAANQGFQVDSGDLVLHGLCADCQARERLSAAKTVTAVTKEQRTAA
ncbi:MULTISPECIES: Fur family transcriptional regulator [Bifidobacterium]|jgi:Fe2+ or Zn2+ uptake regulation protein|nr:Fur family transcriptional regulator [Bifidobacterium tibiigranuli]MCH3974788.1 transcriptional repressor [Bifidobacterium tibiigranuli]MCH4189036.1 transcriptional repressor [Bifidobacterium tibiigranuli]MCH4203756.1 transcriptional repressor [Bifidobacterium tibiigranuli]MCH4274037.1 transcriptional repressor [Bifidobacterium tibiigranuli]MCI1212019.1 transcriptional repressor [Bifidobacterium tibiigranuli]